MILTRSLLMSHLGNQEVCITVIYLSSDVEINDALSHTEVKVINLEVLKLKVRNPEVDILKNREPAPNRLYMREVGYEFTIGEVPMAP